MVRAVASTSKEEEEAEAKEIIDGKTALRNNWSTVGRITIEDFLWDSLSIRWKQKADLHECDNTSFKWWSWWIN